MEPELLHPGLPLPWYRHWRESLSHAEICLALFFSPHSEAWEGCELYNQMMMPLTQISSTGAFRSLISNKVIYLGHCWNGLGSLCMMAWGSPETHPTLNSCGGNGFPLSLSFPPNLFHFCSVGESHKSQSARLGLGWFLTWWQKMGQELRTCVACGWNHHLIVNFHLQLGLLSDRCELAGT